MQFPSKIAAVLLQAGINHFHSVELVTTPRVFGYSFNPVSFYFVYKNKERDILGIIFEVNNTFGEKHLYLCDERNQIPNAAFPYSYQSRRGFHVSPFNNRSGSYDFHVRKEGNILNLVINFRNYVDAENGLPDNRHGKLHFIAKVWGQSQILDFKTFIYLLVCYPFTAMLTVPRIMFEAAKLTYLRKLKVFQRPIPYVDDIGGKTIKRKSSSTFHTVCKKAVLEHMDKSGVDIMLRFPDQKSIIVGNSTGSSREVFVKCPSAFVWYIIHPESIFLGLYLAFVKGAIGFNALDFPIVLRAHGLTNIHIDDLLKSKVPLKAETLTNKSFTIWLGKKLLTIEWFLFRNSADFHGGSDTWNFEQRCMEYIVSNQPNPLPEWNGIDDISDEFSNLAKESIRASFFLQCLRNLDNQMG